MALGGGEAPATAAPPATPARPSRCERADLVDRENLSGTLGYADAGTLAAGVSGTLTGLREPGTVVTRGHSLYAVDGEPAAFLLYGALPAWRDFASGMTDGEDVRQLERNLRALGYDPGTVDDDWDWETTAAVKAFQRDRDLDDDGTLARGEIVFRDGATRIGEAKGEVGESVAPGRPVAAISSVEREVVVALDARRQHLARRGDKVTVELPTGDEVGGRITSVGKVASKAGEDERPDRRRHDHAARPPRRARPGAGGRRLRGRAGEGRAGGAGEGAARPPGRRLRARAAATARKLPVEAGLYADDLVEVSGDGVREGLKVVTAR